MADSGNAATASQVQFQYNSDFPSLSPQDPNDFPPADPSPCARITTRVYHPRKSRIETVQNVLVRTMLPPTSARQPRNHYMDGGNDEELSSSSSEDDSMEEDDLMDDTAMAILSVGEPVSPNSSNAGEGIAYWMQRTVREAIYGRVCFAIVLRRRPRVLGGDPSQQAEWEVTEEHCAIKEMSWQHIRKERDRLAEDPIKEVSAMQFLKKWHEQRAVDPTRGTTHSSSFQAIMETNIMMPLDLLSDDRHLYSIMPFCNGGELFDRLDLNERFSESEARYWMHQVLNGIENLQQSGICHRDMSLENLLVHENGCLIIDMGMCLRIPYANDTLANSFNNMSLDNGGNNDPFCLKGKAQPRHLITPQGTCGKWIYMSPEVYKNKDPFDGFAVDMWAAGVILFLMLTGFPPWEKACGTDDRFKYMTAGYLVQMLTEWEVGLTPDAMDLLQRMLFIDPKDRLSLDQVRAHPWMVNGTRQGPTGAF